MKQQNLYLLTLYFSLGIFSNYSTLQAHVPSPLIITTSISVGELIDKITILEIKAKKIKEHHKLHNIRHELNELEKIAQQLPQLEILISLKEKLKAVNMMLWKIEDKLRQKEHEQLFDDTFIQLARSVYLYNDTRFAIKSEINRLLTSGIIEEKSYTDYAVIKI